MAKQKFVINDNGRSLYAALDAVRRLQEEHKYVVVTVERVGKQRTDKQRAALHLWLDMVAACLNDHHIGHKAIWAVKEVDVPWNKDSVKEELFRPIFKAIAMEDSTNDANTKHYGQVEQILAKHIAENFGVTLPPWPVEKDKPKV